MALGQSSFLPHMFFAWDARGLVGLLRRAEFANVNARTHVVERVSPLRLADEAYLLEAIFRGTWGERLRPYLSAEDFAELTALCDA